MTLYNSDQNFWRESVVRTTGWRILLVVCATLGHLAPGSSCRYVNELVGKFPDQKTSMCQEKLWISAVGDFFPIGQLVSDTVSCKAERICLFLLSYIELELYPKRWQLYRRLHPFINDPFFTRMGSFVAIIRPERVAYARAGETLARVPRVALGKISLARGIHYRPSIFYSFARAASLYCEHYVYIYTHIWHRTDCIWITVATK
jgi:hypothetical protein